MVTCDDSNKGCGNAYDYNKSNGGCGPGGCPVYGPPSAKQKMLYPIVYGCENADGRCSKISEYRVGWLPNGVTPLFYQNIEIPTGGTFDDTRTPLSNTPAVRESAAKDLTLLRKRA